MIITQENKIVLGKRLKSLLWRAGMMIASLVVCFALENLELLNIAPSISVVLGLVLGEVSKILNSKK